VAELRGDGGAGFASWVPTTSGHLSFSAVGRHLQRGACFNNLDRVSDGAPLGVAVVQTRTNRDARWPFRPLGQHRFHLFLVATPEPALTPYFNSKGELDHRRDSRGALRGTVHWFAGGKTYRERHADRRVVSELGTRLDRLNYDPGSDGLDWVGVWRREFEERADATLEFVLYRTGEIRLSGSLEHYYGSAEEKVRSRMVAARHAYYFIKDCAHHHHHHRPTDDQLLPLVRLADNGLSEDANWRREVLWALTRVIGRFRHTTGNVGGRQALGVIAYAEAFQMTLARVRRRASADTHVADDSLATFSFGQQRASIEVAKEVDNWKRQSGFSLFTLTLASLISLASLWGVAARFAAELKWGKPNIFWFDLPRIFYDRYETFLLFVICLILVVYDRTLGLRSGRRSIVEIPVKAALGLAAAARHKRSLAARRIAFWGFVAATLALWVFALGLWP
jgi:hypothetical protein